MAKVCKLRCIKCSHEWTTERHTYEGRDALGFIKNKSGPVKCPNCKDARGVRRVEHEERNRT